MSTKKEYYEYEIEALRAIANEYRERLEKIQTEAQEPNSSTLYNIRKLSNMKGNDKADK